MTLFRLPVVLAVLLLSMSWSSTTAFAQVAMPAAPREAVTTVASGLTNPQISEKLFISIDTVDSHRKNLYTKLKINNTALLVRFAMENNLL